MIENRADQYSSSYLADLEKFAPPPYHAVLTATPEEFLARMDKDPSFNRMARGTKTATSPFVFLTGAPGLPLGVFERGIKKEHIVRVPLRVKHPEDTRLLHALAQRPDTEIYWDLTDPANKLNVSTLSLEETLRQRRSPYARYVEKLLLARNAAIALPMKNEIEEALYKAADAILSLPDLAKKALEENVDLCGLPPADIQPLPHLQDSVEIFGGVFLETISPFLEKGFRSKGAPSNPLAYIDPTPFAKAQTIDFRPREEAVPMAALYVALTGFNRLRRFARLALIRQTPKGNIGSVVSPVAYTSLCAGRAEIMSHLRQEGSLNPRHFAPPHPV